MSQIDELEETQITVKDLPLTFKVSILIDCEVNLIHQFIFLRSNI
jgi:hypothetical protein